MSGKISGAHCVYSISGTRMSHSHERVNIVHFFYHKLPKVIFENVYYFTKHNKKNLVRLITCKKCVFISAEVKKKRRLLQLYKHSSITTYKITEGKKKSNIL